MVQKRLDVGGVSPQHVPRQEPAQYRESMDNFVSCHSFRRPGAHSGTATRHPGPRV